MPISEAWAFVDGYDQKYEVSNFGNVRSLRFNKVKELHKQTQKSGYLKVALWKDGIRTDVSVHRLVALSFVVKDDKHNVVNHIDGNPSNNKFYNLEWTTQSGNIQHAWDTGLNKMTETKRAAMRKNAYDNGKLSFEKAKEIREIHRTGSMSIKELASKYAIDRSVISRIIHNKAWIVDADV